MKNPGFISEFCRFNPEGRDTRKETLLQNTLPIICLKWDYRHITITKYTHSPFGVVLHATLGIIDKSLEASQSKYNLKKGKRKLKSNEAQKT